MNPFIFVVTFVLASALHINGEAHVKGVGRIDDGSKFVSLNDRNIYTYSPVDGILTRLNTNGGVGL